MKARRGGLEVVDATVTFGDINLSTLSDSALIERRAEIARKLAELAAESSRIDTMLLNRHTRAFELARQASGREFGKVGVCVGDSEIVGHFERHVRLDQELIGDLIRICARVPTGVSVTYSVNESLLRHESDPEVRASVEEAINVSYGQSIISIRKHS